MQQIREWMTIRRTVGLVLLVGAWFSVSAEAASPEDLASPDKVHIAAVFTRYDAKDQAISAYNSLYVVERFDGRWGVRARSSFAP